MANNILKEVFQLSLQDELERMIKLNMNSIIYQSLSDEEVEQLAIKIGLLPSEYRSILFFRYCFNNTPSETDRLLEIENSIGKLRYIQKMLSDLMGINNSWIDDKSMERACKIALIEDTKDYNNIGIVHKPNYSKAFRRKLKDIKIKQNPNNILMLIAKRVAVFILVCILSFSAVLAVNAEAREKVFDWVIEVFEKFSIFTPKNIDEDDILVKLTSFKIKYIPTGFKLVDIHEGRNMVIYNYSADYNQEFDIKLFAPSSENKSYYDTEGIEIEEITFKGSQAYMWQIDDMAYLVWYQDGIECHIIGNLNKDVILKVAENISK
ncbi:MAG TPA: DUF4367 domain-containing protein [Epulopiscium sp.]|nr:DUF4367 domain-containing protein [Candidatus Epulonipiscium sp.]